MADGKETGEGIPVFVPFLENVANTYPDAIGLTRSEAISHFTYYGRFEKSISEIFHMQFVKGTLHIGEDAAMPGSLTLRVPVPKDGGNPVVRASAATAEESADLLDMFEFDADEYDFVEGLLVIGTETVL